MLRAGDLIIGINLWPVVDGRYALDGYRTALGLCWLLQVAAVAWLAYAERADRGTA